jgi:hypothetical protein
MISGEIIEWEVVLVRNGAKLEIGCTVGKKGGWVWEYHIGYTIDSISLPTPCLPTQIHTPVHTPLHTHTCYAVQASVADFWSRIQDEAITHTHLLAGRQNTRQHDIKKH